MFKLFVVAVILGLAAANKFHKEATVKDLVNDISPEGNFRYGFETSNGINVQASGSGDVATGSVSWTSPEGIPVQLAYVADANGYQPQGSHLPVAPPTPEYIIRALEWIRAHPSKDEVVVRRF